MIVIIDALSLFWIFNCLRVIKCVGVVYLRAPHFCSCHWLMRMTATPAFADAIGALLNWGWFLDVCCLLLLLLFHLSLIVLNDELFKTRHPLASMGHRRVA